MSPFTQENLLENEENIVQDIIYQLKISSFIYCKEKLANRLLKLLNDAKEEGETISVISLRGFFIFIRNNPNVKCPMISLTPDNNIYASWRNEKGEVLSMHFLHDGYINYVKSIIKEDHHKQTIWLSDKIKFEMLGNKEIQQKILV